MPVVHFPAVAAKIIATLAPARLILRSRVMATGVMCEILAFGAATLNWYNVSNFWWLPNATLMLATVGAVIVASKVAWDYHGRGLNAKQGEDVGTILSTASLNETQANEVTEAVTSSGLTTRQKSDLPTALQGIELAGAVFAQKAISDAAYQLQSSDHGYVAVINVNTRCQIEVQYVAPPTGPDKCQRQHEFEPESNLDLLGVASSLQRPFHHPAYLWKHPVTRELRHTNPNDPASFTKELVFSLEDCVPKWRVPTVGDYVLTRDPSGRYAWVRQP